MKISRHLFLALLLPVTLCAALKEGDVFPSLGPLRQDSALVETQGRLCLVDFWASWCAPCRESFAMLGRVQKDYAASGLVVAGIGVDERVEAHDAFVRKMAPGFATAWDRNQEIVSKVEVQTMPSSYLVSPEGRILAVFRGFHGSETYRELCQAIDAALKSKPPQ